MKMNFKYSSSAALVNGKNFNGNSIGREISTVAMYWRDGLIEIFDQELGLK